MWEYLWEDKFIYLSLNKVDLIRVIKSDMEKSIILLLRMFVYDVFFIFM